MPSDQSILNGLRARNPDACKWLVDHFEDPLFRFFVCKHRDYHLAQEQTAETFAQLIRSLPSMRGSQEQLHGFVFSVARYVQLRHWRRPKVTGCDPELAKCVADPQPSPATQLADREQLERVLSAISQFESPVREILIFRFVEGFTLDEIVAATALPLGTVKSHIHRGIVRLRKLMSDKECQT